MEKAQSISVQGVALSLAVAFAVSAGLYLVKHNLIMREAAPLFTSEEIVAVKPAAAIWPHSRIAVETAAPASVAEVSLPPAVSVPLPLVPPAITYQFIPEYPVSLLDQGLSGTTLLSIQIGLTGRPDRVEVKNSSGVAEFDAAAVKAAERWLFSPATQGGAAVASCLEVPVRFEVK